MLVCPVTGEAGLVRDVEEREVVDVQQAQTAMVVEMAAA